MSTLTTQKQIAAALGVSKQKLSKLIHENKIQPPPVILIKNNTRYYDAIAAEKLIKSEPLKPENLLLAQAISNKPGRPQIDNIMATQFITRASACAKPKTLADIVKKHIGQRPKTTVVHLVERNDYIPPNSALARASHNAEHRLSGVFF